LVPLLILSLTRTLVSISAFLKLLSTKLQLMKVSDVLLTAPPMEPLLIAWLLTFKEQLSASPTKLDDNLNSTPCVSTWDSLLRLWKLHLILTALIPSALSALTAPDALNALQAELLPPTKSTSTLEDCADTKFLL